METFEPENAVLEEVFTKRLELKTNPLVRNFVVSTPKHNSRFKIFTLIFKFEELFDELLFVFSCLAVGSLFAIRKSFKKHF